MQQHCSWLPIDLLVLGQSNLHQHSCEVSLVRYNARFWLPSYSSVLEMNRLEISLVSCTYQQEGRLFVKPGLLANWHGHPGGAITMQIKRPNVTVTLDRGIHKDKQLR